MPQENKHALARLLGHWRLIIALILPIVLLVGCQQAPSIMAPASPSARRISDLGWQLFAIAFVVFVAVEALLIYAIIRFRSRGRQEVPRQIHGHTRLEIAWTAAPGIVLIGVLFTTIQTMSAIIVPPAQDVRVNVIGHQWWWEVQYPDLGIVSANEIHMPVGKTITVDLTSADVIHSFWVAELGGKMDVIPGHTNQTWFQPEREGVFRGFCAEFCGVQHANMGFVVVSENQEAFDAWVNLQRQQAAQPTDPVAQQGAQAFTTSGCAACHTIDGTPARGRLGPNLTHVGSRRYIAANTLLNTPENMARWIADPQGVKTGNLMNVPPLSDEVVSQLSAYLGSLK